jgi:hypothetical protein
MRFMIKKLIKERGYFNMLEKYGKGGKQGVPRGTLLKGHLNSI